MKKVLMILTNHEELGETGQKTGFWLEELAAPYYELAGAGFQIDLASLAGGKPPADPKSTGTDVDTVRRFLDDRVALGKLESTSPLAGVSADYDAYFIVGGHGVVFDLACSDVVARLLGGAWKTGKVVAAVCHGPAALVLARDAEGKPIVAGKRVAAFSNEEEEAVGLAKVVPFALETKLVELGARYERGPTFRSFAVRDGRLVTGQNPQSSTAVARLVIDALV